MSDSLGVRVIARTHFNQCKFRDASEGASMKRLLLCLVTLFAFLCVLAGCGGSGSGTSDSGTVSGVAAAGAPVSGKVTLVDRNGVQRTANIDDNGAFVLDVAGLTAPFIVKAEGLVGGQSHTLFAVTSHDGTVHVNPYTNLILAVALGGNPARLLDSTATIDYSKLDDAALLQAQGKVKALLQPLLDRYGIATFEPLSGAYSAQPGNRLDAVLDVVSITIDNAGTLVMRNNLTGDVLASGGVSAPDEIALDVSKAPGAVFLDDLAAITERVAQLCTLFKKGAGMTRQSVEEFFFADAYYGTSNGQTREQGVDSIFTVWGSGSLDQYGRLKSIRNVRLVRDLSTDYSGRNVSRAYLLNYDFIFEGGALVKGNNTTYAREADSGVWKFIGDPVGSSLGDNYGSVVTSVDVPVSPIIFDVPDITPVEYLPGAVQMPQ